MFEFTDGHSHDVVHHTHDEGVNLIANNVNIRLVCVPIGDAQHACVRMHTSVRAGLTVSTDLKLALAMAAIFVVPPVRIPHLCIRKCLIMSNRCAGAR